MLDTLALSGLKTAMPMMHTDESDDIGGRVFTSTACSKHMVHDLFKILGAYSSHAQGMAFFKDCDIFGLLSKLGMMPRKGLYHPKSDCVPRLHASRPPRAARLASDAHAQLPGI